MVQAARWVKPPVLGYAEGRVVIPLLPDVPLPGVFRGHFQHEVLGLALVLYGVAPVADDPPPVNPEGDGQVGDPQAQPLPQVPAHRDFAHDGGRFRGAAEVTARDVR